MIQLIASLLIWFQLDDYVNSIKSNTGFVDSDNDSAIRNSVITTLLIMDIFTVIGLFGALKENYCLSITYAIFMTVDAITTVGLAFRSSSYALASLLTIIVVIMAYSYTHRIRLNQLREQTLMSLNDTQPQQVIIGTTKQLMAHNSQFINMPDMPEPPPAYAEMDAKKN